MMSLGALLYCAYVIPQWGESYLDFGDGNYMYIASRIAEGAVVYRDILAPQPPCHLFLGALIVKIGSISGFASPLYLFRGFSLVLHIASALLAAALARRAWGLASAGVAAFWIFLFIPIGLWWSMGYQSEPLENFFLLLMMNGAIRNSRRADILTGIFGALAALTNATAVPFLFVLIIFMIARNRARAVRIAVPAMILAAFVTVALELWTGGYFVRNAVFNQVGTYPRDGLAAYAVGKIIREGNDIFWLDGFYIFAAVAGLGLFLRRSALDADARDGLAWFTVSTMLSFLYVTKGGTEDYIFTLAEPGIAVMSAGALVGFWRFAWGRPTELDGKGEGIGVLPVKPAGSGATPADTGANSYRQSSPLRSAFHLLLLFFCFGPGATHYLRLWNGVAWELPDYDSIEKSADGQPLPNVQQVKQWIERYSRPGDTILAPPFYAFITGRRVWQDYSELFIWRIKDHNDRLDKNERGEGWMKTRALAAALEKKELPLVIIEMDQTGQLPEVKSALEAGYTPILKEPYRTLNTRLGVYIPKPD
ncbi:hypothetical protein HYR69_10815 [Candidatus Sumerlaeota bacterium]|nr:hypothetical protein [Candidatus Sumerlaeota bacterium]